MEGHLLREDESEAGVNESGELSVRNQTVALGYWNDEKATQETLVDGWARLATHRRFPSNGYLFAS